MGNSCETLHVRADQAGNHLGLGLTQLGELGGDMCHRAVMLAELATRSDRRSAGSVTLCSQRVSERLCPRERIVTRLAYRFLTAILKIGDLCLGKCCHRAAAPLRRNPAQSRRGKIVVGMRPDTLAGSRGEFKEFGGTAAPTGTALMPLALGNQALGKHRVEMPANRRRLQPQLRANVAGRGSTLCEQGNNPIPSTEIRRLRQQSALFHYISVTYFSRAGQTTPPVIPATSS